MKLIDYDDFIKNDLREWLVTYPILYKKIKYKINRTDLAILNLLKHGHNVLYIAGDSSRNRFSNAISYFDLFYLMVDFDEEISEKTFFVHLKDDFDYYWNPDIEEDNSDELSKLNRLKQISKTRYSNLNLLPGTIKHRRDGYLKKLDNDEYVFPIENAMEYTNKSLEDSAYMIKHVIEEYGKFFKLEDCFSNDFFESEYYENLIEVSRTFSKNLDEFISVNMKLTDAMGIKALDNIDSIRYLEDIGILIRGNHYIGKGDRDLLNEFLKSRCFEKNVLSDMDFPEKFIKCYGEENFIEQIGNDVSYSQLVDSNLFRDMDKIKFNLFYCLEDINYLVEIGKHLKKQLYVISKFYQDYDCFDGSAVSFEVDSPISEIRRSFNEFIGDLKFLSEFIDFVGYEYDDANVELFVELVKGKQIDEDRAIDIFYFNVYNDILNNFLSEYGDFNEYDLDLKRLEDRYNLIKSQSRDLLEVRFINSIRTHKFSSESVMNQRYEFLERIMDSDMDSIKEVLMDYPESFTALKRVCLMSERYICCLNSNIKFDYVIIDKGMGINLDDGLLSGLSDNFIVVG